jgi:hypothetical protein
VLAAGAVDYVSARTPASLLFVGGAGAVTVGAAVTETLFGGSGGGSYAYGAAAGASGAGALFVGGGGADTLAGAGPLVAFGHGGEHLIVQASGSVAATTGTTFVGFGGGETIDASHARAGNTFVLDNTTLPASAGGSFTGDTTLIGSPGDDIFAVFIDASAPTAHTITIDNWQASDTMAVYDLANPGGQLIAADTAAIAAFLSGGGSWFALSDGTTIDFAEGVRPTGIAHG